MYNKRSRSHFAYSGMKPSDDIVLKDGQEDYEGDDDTPYQISVP